MNKLTDEQIRKFQAAAQAADKKADSWLIKILDSQWSWAILIGMLAAAWLLGYLL